MRSISELFGKHKGRTAFVMGGGPSLPLTAPRIPDDAVLISVNSHGIRLHRAGMINRAPDYAVHLDPDAYPVERDPTTMVISPFAGQADYFFARGSDVWDAGFSSAPATWLALFFGCDPVVLTGMDLYQTGTYWDDANAESSGRYQAFVNQVNAWRQAFRFCPRSDRIRAADGPLTGVFGEWTG